MIPVPIRPHYLFVVVNGTTQAQAATVKILQFLAHSKPYLVRLKINLEVKKISPEMLQNARLKQALIAKGITSFPALKTSKRILMGVRNIAEFYSVLMDEFDKILAKHDDQQTMAALGRQGVDVPGGASMDDIYRDYFASELTIGAAERDGGDEGMGDGGSDAMMARMHDMIKRRDQINAKRNKRSGAYLDPASQMTQSDRGRKADNVADEELIDRLIATTTAPVTAETLDKAFKSEGGSGVDDAREDLMVRAFWDNQSESI